MAVENLFFKIHVNRTTTMCDCTRQVGVSTCFWRWSWQTLQALLFLATSVGLFSSGSVGAIPSPFAICTVEISFTDPGTHNLSSEMIGLGVYGVNSELRPEVGKVIHVLSEDGANHGCSPPVNVPAGEPWIALIQRGGCKFHKKVWNSAVLKNASAVVIYNNVMEENLITMTHGELGGGFISVFIGLKSGDRVASLVDSGVPVYMNISLQEMSTYKMTNNSAAAATSALPTNRTFIFVSMGLLGTIVLGLGCLLAYGVRKARGNRKSSHSRIVFTLPAPPCDKSQVEEGLLTNAESQESTESPANYSPNGRA